MPPPSNWNGVNILKLPIKSAIFWTSSETSVALRLPFSNSNAWPKFVAAVVIFPGNSSNHAIALFLS